MLSVNSTLVYETKFAMSQTQKLSVNGPLGSLFTYVIYQAFLVFRKKDLYLIIMQKLTFMKSGGFHEIWQI